MVGCCAPLQSQLVSYAMVRWAEASSEKLEVRPSRSWTKPQGWEALEQLLGKTAMANGMELDTNTATNGDCGVDAILRNVERLGIACSAAATLLGKVQRQGRDAGLQHLRNILVHWMRTHPSVTIVDGVSLQELAIMEGRWADWGAYLEAMATKRTWIDTPVLIAASALFQCQIVCLLSSTPEPQLIASPTLTVSGDIPVFLMANVGNWHFFALRPLHHGLGFGLGADAPAPVEECAPCDFLLQSIESHDDWAALSSKERQDEVEMLCGECQDTVVDLEGAGAAACVEDSDEGVALFELSECLAGWCPFGEDGGMNSALVCAARKLDPGNCGEAAGNAFQALRLRRSIQLLQWEVVDGVGREHVHQLARRHFIITITIIIIDPSSSPSPSPLSPPSPSSLSSLSSLPSS